jgi:hypothetical protein
MGMKRTAYKPPFDYDQMTFDRDRFSLNILLPDGEIMTLSHESQSALLRVVEDAYPKLAAGRNKCRFRADDLSDDLSGDMSEDLPDDLIEDRKIS